MQNVGGKSCKIVIDNKSYMKVVFTWSVSKVQVTLKLYLSPYKVVWINETSFVIT